MQNVISLMSHADHLKATVGAKNARAILANLGFCYSGDASARQNTVFWHHSAGAAGKSLFFHAIGAKFKGSCSNHLAKSPTVCVG